VVGSAGAVRGTAPASPCLQGGEHDWRLTYNAKVLMPWLKAEAANVCQKCSALAIVTRSAAAE
jgi:hypothetical protein